MNYLIVGKYWNIAINDVFWNESWKEKNLKSMIGQNYAMSLTNTIKET